MKSAKKILPYIVYALVAFFIVITLRDNLEEVKQYQIERWWLLIPAMALYSAMFFSNSAIWAKLMEFVKAKISWRDSFYVYVSTFIVRYIPGSVWAVAARATMNFEYGVKVSTSIWGWVIENVSFLLIGLGFSIFAVLSMVSVPQGMVALVVAAFAFCSIFLLRYELLERLVRTVLKNRFPKQAEKGIGSFDLSYQQRFTLVGLYIISWIVFSLQFYFVVWAVTGDPGLSFFELAGINALAWSIGYISIITPSGAGVRESVMILGLTTLGGMDSVDAIVIALLARVTVILGEVAFFGVVKLLHFFRKDGKDRKTKNE